MRKQVRLRPSTFKKLLFVFLLSARLPVCFRTPFDVLTKQRHFARYQRVIVTLPPGSENSIKNRNLCHQCRSDVRIQG
jgi:hypothetical protein